MASGGIDTLLEIVKLFQNNTNMNHFELEDLPVDVFEQISTYLDYHDIAQLEKTSKKILTTIQELNLWRRVALTLIHKSHAPAVQDVLNYIKKNAAMCPKVCKILIGVTVHTTRIVDCFERMLKKRKLALMFNSSTTIIARKKKVIKEVLYYYVKTLEMITGMKEKVKRCAALHTVVKLDVKYHIDEYKRQTWLIQLLE